MTKVMNISSCIQKHYMRKCKINFIICNSINNKMRLLELFSGTHSIGKVARERGIEVISLDRDLPADIKIDINDWDYTIFPKNHFDIITASPVCMYWSVLRPTWFGREIKAHPGKIFTREILEQDIEDYGMPMVDKVFEILDYFNPTYFWIENPQTSRMKEYISELIPYYDVDYCQYGFKYRKRTRFWTNVQGFNPRLCDKNTCTQMITIEKKRLHKQNCGNGEIARLVKKYLLSTNDIGGRINRLQRYRIPSQLINELLDCCV